MNDRVIEERETEFGVAFEGHTVPCVCEEEARLIIMAAGGKLVAREVYSTAWAEVSE